MFNFLGKKFQFQILFFLLKISFAHLSIFLSFLKLTFIVLKFVLCYTNFYFFISLATVLFCHVWRLWIHIQEGKHNTIELPPFPDPFWSFCFWRCSLTDECSRCDECRKMSNHSDLAEVPTFSMAHYSIWFKTLLISSLRNYLFRGVFCFTAKQFRQI